MTINSVCPHCSQQCELINEKAGLDIYGNRIDSNGGISQPVSTSTSSNETSSMLTVECPCCKKVLAATRFAPHLEKCMGMGRQSARKRGNLMMKMAAGSENESDDGGSEIIMRTPAALQSTEDSFSQTSSGGGGNTASSEQVKKVKVSPSKSKNTTTTPVTTTNTNTNNSKQNSPSKAKRTTPSKELNKLQMPAAQKPAASLIDDQENSLISGNSNNFVKGKLMADEGGKGNVFVSPKGGAKTLLSNKRVVLADKTPNNIKRPLQAISTNSQQRNNASSPIKNINVTSPTPFTHPSLRDIAITTKTLTNPPDLFLQPLQKRRSIRNQKENFTEVPIASNTTLNSNSNTVTSKLIAVFPTTSDELDFEEIEHAASSLVNDDDSLDFLSGTSKIIPNLELHENIDFTPLLRIEAESKTKEPATPDVAIVIEPIVIEFKIEAQENESIDNEHCC